MSSNLTQERLHSLLDYDQETGIFRWLKSRGRASEGSIAGTINSSGYLNIRLDGRSYRAHRLAFLWLFGAFPPDQVDHIDGNRLNNALKNLREATRSENQQNIAAAPRHSASGFLGASFHKRSGRWNARIRVVGKRIFLGYFDTPESANAAYMKAKDELHPTHSRLRTKP